MTPPSSFVHRIVPVLVFAVVHCDRASELPLVLGFIAFTPTTLAVPFFLTVSEVVAIVGILVYIVFVVPVQTARTIERNDGLQRVSRVRIAGIDLK